MNRQLFVCNSVYQVLVAMWIKYIYHQREVSGLIISVIRTIQWRDLCV